MKIRITKTFAFEMAHALYGYHGACRNIHGHSYVLSVTVTGEPVNDASSSVNGMVIDFSELKKIVKERIIDEVDHALMLNGNSPHRKITHLRETFEKVIYVEYQPTCENILLDFKDRLKVSLPGTVKLHSLCLRETAGSMAEWYWEDNR